ncbi:MAG: type II secretion system protein [Formivibrio sp.]|nr:type II secretion system protein [Formivibrio sp.]
MKKDLGFTLVEISIVLIIAGLMLSGMLGAYLSQIEANRIRETRQALHEVRDALIGFALSNGHLPCPANPALANTATLAGQEERSGVTGNCTYIDGVLPWATLGVKELDAWGKRYSYRVTSYFADTSNATIGPSATCIPAADPAVSFAICSVGDITILPQAGTLGGIPAVAVIVSHGKNLRGAYGPSGGTRLGNLAGDELENANNDTSFVDHPFVHDADPLAENYFDDLVDWVSPSILIGKMAAASRLP